MDPNIRLVPGQRELYSNPGRYRRLVGKLNYITVTRLGIAFVMSVVIQFLSFSCDSHRNAIIWILRYIKRAPGKGLLYENKRHRYLLLCRCRLARSPSDCWSTSEYCVLVGGNLISWKSKKQNVVVRSSAKAEYRAMANATCDLIWIKHVEGIKAH